MIRWSWLALLAVAAACSHDFDAFTVPEGGGEADGADGDASDASSGDATEVDAGDAGALDGAGDGCAAPVQCIDDATRCGQDCENTLTLCTAKCTGTGCKNQCKNAATTCHKNCGMTCVVCSEEAGCSEARGCPPSS